VLLPDLINKSSEDNINYRPDQGRTALMFAAQYGQLRIVRLLVENGARVNLRANGGETAASLAYDNGEIEIYNYLKANGAMDFEPRQVAQQPTAPTPAPSSSTTNVYVQPSAPVQSNTAPAPSTPRAPQLRMGTYTDRSVTGSELNLFTNTNSATHRIKDRTGTSTGNITISGDQLIITWNSGPLNGRRSVYHIDSENQFSTSGETWRMGF